MRLGLKHTIFSIICGLFLMSSIVSAQTNSAKGNEIVFPEVEGWEMGEITTYPTEELGYSIPYQSEEGGGTVTIYVYNGGLKKIADGIDDKNVKSEIKKAGSDIELYGQKGYYDNVKKIKDDTVSLGGKDGKVKALYSLYSFKIRGNEVDSEIYLFGFQNNFIKIRATRPKGKDSAENVEVNNLLAEIGKLFSK